MKIVHEGKDSNEPIRVVKFSPDASILAIGSEDSCIYTYNAKDFFSKRNTISVHKAPVLYLDFTADGRYLMSVDSTKRISYSEVSSGMHIPSPATLREEKWATWSAPVGWPVQGLWICQPMGVEPTSMQRSWGGMLIAAGSTAGRLAVAHNPCQARAGFVGSAGHSGPISQVAWLAGDGTIITIGTKDHCVLQWKCIFDTTRESGDEGGLSCEDSEVDRDAGHEVKESDIVRTTDNFGKVQQWSTSIAPPSDPVDDDTTVPGVVPELDFVHGARLSDCRQTVCYNDDGHTVYIVANFGVIFDRDSQVQHVYQGHANGLISLAVDSAGKVAATGELHKNPELHLWDARTAEKICKFQGLHRRGITSLAFSASSEFLVSLGQDVMHSVVVLRSPSGRWTDGHVLCSSSVSPSKMLWALHVQDNEFPVIVGGAGTIFFFRPSGVTMERTRGVFGKRRKLQPVLCAVQGEPVTGGGTAGQSAILTGTVTGHIYVWENQKVTSTITAHDSPIFAIAKLRRGYATAGKDGLVKLWSARLQQVHTYNLQTFSPTPNAPPCHALSCNLLGTRIAVGMRSGEIYEISLATHSNIMLVEGHSYRELHALDTNPQVGDEYATLGDDGVLRVWSYQLRTCIRRANVEAAGRALTYSPDGTKIFIGLGGDPTQATKDGAFMVLDNRSLEILFEDRKAKLYITDIKFSPSGEIVAMASADSRVYLHSARDYAHLSTIDTPSKTCAVTRVDFSLDGLLLRLSTSLDELFHFTIETREVITAPLAVRDVHWTSNNCPYTWFSQGVWRPSNHNINVLNVVLNSRNSLAVASYQNGDVRLYRFPVQASCFPSLFPPSHTLSTSNHLTLHSHTS